MLVDGVERGLAFGDGSSGRIILCFVDEKRFLFFLALEVSRSD